MQERELPPVSVTWQNAGSHLQSEWTYTRVLISTPGNMYKSTSVYFPSLSAQHLHGARASSFPSRAHERDYEVWSLNKRRSFCLNTTIDNTRTTLEVPEQPHEFVRLLMSDVMIVKI